MNDKFLITNIHRVIMVGKEEYPEKVTEFKSKRVTHNELIFHLSGEALVRFNGLELPTFPGTIRFLPQGDNNGYTVERKIRGDCIDVFFDTDTPISNTAFVMDMSKRGNIAMRGIILNAYPLSIKYSPRCKRAPISRANTTRRYALR